jgi:predicted alpha/beta hydrolase family esterase
MPFVQKTLNVYQVGAKTDYVQNFQSWENLVIRIWFAELVWVARPGLTVFVNHSLEGEKIVRLILQDHIYVLMDFYAMATFAKNRSQMILHVLEMIGVGPACIAAELYTQKK